MTGARWPARIALALAAAGCGASSAPPADVPPGDGAGSGGTPTQQCAAAIDVAQPVPTAGPGATLHASAEVIGGIGAPALTWQVQFDGVPIDAQKSMDGSEIDVAVPRAGVYVLGLSSPPCTPAVAPVNVPALGAVPATLRLQIVSPHDAAVPPMDLVREVQGGANADLGAISVMSGRLVQAVVLGPLGGVPAYLAFSPSATPDAIVEAFSDGSGAAAVQLVMGAPYSVLVVPSANDLAPRRIGGWLPGAALQVDAGVLISGSVVRPGIPGPADVPLAGATVRVVSGGVPSTLAVTAADGSFALRAAAPAGAATVEVTPPDGSGLPRLSATSDRFDLSALRVRYAANPGLVDLGGAVVQRQGVAVPRAGLTVVGALDTAGAVMAGAAVVAVAAGQVRIAATADAVGALPRTMVPAGMLSAVIEVGPGDLAVTPLDTTGGARPETLDAPAMQLITTAVTAMIDGQPAGVPGALADLVPAGALAMAGAPMLRLTATATGAIAATLPAGGRYELRLHDPRGLGAPLVIADRPITTIASSYLLPAAIRIQGALLRDGTLALAGASVQLMCIGCSGFDAALPLAEAASDAAGRFTLAVPDPGTR